MMEVRENESSDEDFYTPPESEVGDNDSRVIFREELENLFGEDWEGLNFQSLTEFSFGDDEQDNVLHDIEIVPVRNIQHSSDKTSPNLIPREQPLADSCKRCSIVSDATEFAGDIVTYSNTTHTDTTWCKYSTTEELLERVVGEIQCHSDFKKKLSILILTLKCMAFNRELDDEAIRVVFVILDNMKFFETLNDKILYAKLCLNSYYGDFNDQQSAILSDVVKEIETLEDFNLKFANFVSAMKALHEEEDVVVLTSTLKKMENCACAEEKLKVLSDAFHDIQNRKYFSVRCVTPIEGSGDANTGTIPQTAPTQITLPRSDENPGTPATVSFDEESATLFSVATMELEFNEYFPEHWVPILKAAIKRCKSSRKKISVLEEALGNMQLFKQFDDQMIFALAIALLIIDNRKALEEGVEVQIVEERVKSLIRMMEVHLSKLDKQHKIVLFLALERMEICPAVCEKLDILVPALREVQCSTKLNKKEISILTPLLEDGGLDENNDAHVKRLATNLMNIVKRRILNGNLSILTDKLMHILKNKGSDEKFNTFIMILRYSRYSRCFGKRHDIVVRGICSGTISIGPDGVSTEQRLLWRKRKIDNMDGIEICQNFNFDQETVAQISSNVHSIDSDEIFSESILSMLTKLIQVIDKCPDFKSKQIALEKTAKDIKLVQSFDDRIKIALKSTVGLLENSRATWEKGYSERCGKEKRRFGKENDAAKKREAWNNHQLDLLVRELKDYFGDFASEEKEDLLKTLDKMGNFKEEDKKVQILSSSLEAIQYCRQMTDTEREILTTALRNMEKCKDSSQKFSILTRALKDMKYLEDFGPNKIPILSSNLRDISEIFQKCAEDGMEFIKIFPDWEARRTKIMKELDEVVNILNAHQKNGNIAKTFFASLGLIGGIISIVGAVLTTATMGLASPLLIAGLSIAGAGGAGSLGTTVTEVILTKLKVNVANCLIETDRKEFQKLNKWFEHTVKLSESINKIVNFRLAAKFLQDMDKMKDTLTDVYGKVTMGHITEFTLTYGVDNGLSSEVVTKLLLIGVAVYFHPETWAKMIDLYKDRSLALEGVFFTLRLAFQIARFTDVGGDIVAICIASFKAGVAVAKPLALTITHGVFVGLGMIIDVTQLILSIVDMVQGSENTQGKLIKDIKEKMKQEWKELKEVNDKLSINIET